MNEERRKKNIRLNNWHGAAAVLNANMVYPFIGIFAITMNASDLQIAMLSSLPALVSMAIMVPGAWLIDRQPRKKAITAWLMLGTRAFYLVMAAVPFLPTDFRAGALVTTVALMNIPGAVSNVAWQSFIAAVIPQASRSSAFATRSRFMSVTGVITLLFTGRLLDRIGFPVGYQVLFTGAFIIALVELYAFTRLEEEDKSDVERSAPRLGVWQMLSVIRLEGPYLRFAACSLLFHFGWQMAWPLFTRYNVSYMHANNSWISLFSMVNTAGSFLAYPVWARLADRKGNRYMLIFATLGLASSPIWYALSRQLWHIALAQFFVGMFVAGVTLMLFSALLEVTPEANRTSFIAYYNTAINLSATLAPVAGVSLLSRFGIYGALYIAAGMRLLGTAAFYIHSRRERQRSRVSSSLAA
ncbi:MAG: MFS transporter [Bacillota bacterium]